MAKNRNLESQRGAKIDFNKVILEKLSKKRVAPAASDFSTSREKSQAALKLKIEGSIKDT